MKWTKWTLWLLFSDYLSAAVSWVLFFAFRQEFVEGISFKSDDNLLVGLLILPILWLLLYSLQGVYFEVHRLFRSKIMYQTIISTLIGCLIIFLFLILDDEVSTYKNYYQSLSSLLGFHFVITLLPRLLIITSLIKALRKPNRGFRTVILGGSQKALDLYNEIRGHVNSVNQFIGYINVNGNDRSLDGSLPYLGNYKDIPELIRTLDIEEVILAVESSDHDLLKNILLQLDNGKRLIKLLPDTYEIISGNIKMTNLFGVALIEMQRDPMPLWQQAIKRALDILFSIVALVLLLPMYVFSIIAVRFSSPGSIFFLQERIGVDGKVFKIIKFRTMYENAEAAGPQLSSENDPRITPIGRFMRKTRLDEIPQFANVLIGDMSLVGPRPERQFYIDQIALKEPHFNQLTRVRPGITSWGQVKYGYAENVEQMLQRMKYDLIYLKNRSLALDFKIMLHTVIIVFKAKGK